MYVLIRCTEHGYPTAVEGPFDTWDDASRYAQRTPGNGLWMIQKVIEPVE